MSLVTCRWLLLRVFWLLLMIAPVSAIADTIFVYSSVNRLYGVNLDTQEETFLTAASLSATVNALALNSASGLVYYGDDTSIYYWDSALGAGPNSHALINNFDNGFFQAPISNINSTGGSYLNGKYYIGSETDTGFIEEVYELTMSADGRQMVGLQALNINAACNCTQVQLGGFGDIAIIDSPNGPVIYGSSADLTNNNSGTHAGIWRFEIITGTWELLADGIGGQMAESLDGRLFSNVGNSIRELNPNTGQISNQTLINTSDGIWDFTGGFSYDFGDAPDSYGAAYHLVDGSSSPATYLGTQPPDNEPYTQHADAGGTAGFGDDDKGVDDEDGLLVIPEPQVGDTALSLDVSCNSGSVVAWVDFNINGTFDFGERNSNYPVQCTAGNATLSWSGIDFSTAGTSYIRIRAAANAANIYKPTGYVDNGEVEDYEIEVTDILTTTGNCPAGDISHVFTSTDVPIDYSGSANNPIISTVEVPESLIITDINVLNLNATHRRQRGLHWYLSKGTERVWMYGNSCWRNRNLNVSFDDEANNNMQCRPRSGRFYTPASALSLFDGDDAQGTWELQVDNTWASNNGRINGWALEVCTANPVGLVAEIRLGKVAEIVDRNVTITLLAKNVGLQDLSSIELTDNLDNVFGIGNYSVTAAPEILDAPNSNFVANTAYTGAIGADELLSQSGVLAPDEEVSVRFSVEVGFNVPSANNTFDNQAQITALDTNANIVEDLSATGFDLSTDVDSPTIISLDGSVQISGVVFTDTSADSAIAHDGIQQAQELGVPGRAISLVDVASGIELASAITAADGSWVAQLDANYLNQAIDVVVAPVSTTQFISESPANTDSSNSDGRARLVLEQDPNLNRTLIGVIGRPTLARDHTANILPGSSVQYNHVYTSPTHGSVVFNSVAISSSPNSNWSETVFRDLNCNEQVDGADFELISALNVAFEETVCLFVEVTSTSGGNAGDSHSLDLTATMQVDDLAGSTHSVSFTNTNQDITYLIADTAGNLVLEKSVRNISLGGQPVEQNTALPGHVLEYVIQYANNGAGQINDLVINDEAPAYTQVEPASAQCSQTPSALQCTPNTSGSLVNWLFQGSLAPGAQGAVSYRILVE